MATYVVRINTEGEAFGHSCNGDEIGWILRRLAASLSGTNLRSDAYPDKLKDSDGHDAGIAGWANDDAILGALIDAAEWSKALCEEIGKTETNAYASACAALDRVGK